MNLETNVARGARHGRCRLRTAELDSATALQPGQVGVLDFTILEEGAETARIAEVNCY